MYTYLEVLAVGLTVVSDERHVHQRQAPDKAHQAEEEAQPTGRHQRRPQASPARHSLQAPTTLPHLGKRERMLMKVK